jgi:glycosyltransferase involved in cell wall biosynthesis
MKQFCVISAPPDTYSGYGARSRDFIKALYELKKDEWDIIIIPQRWGNTNWGFIDDNIEEWGWMKDLFIKENLTQQPDVWIQVTVPNEFQPLGKVNIGVTAGIETTLCDGSWIEGVNRMNVTLVSSNHAKQVFEQSAFDQKDQQGRLVKHIKLEKPVEVLFEGVDLNKYFYIVEKEMPTTELVESIDDIKEDFNYLFVGHWLQGELGQDRKDVGMLIKTFLETFKGKTKKPGLILKTSSATYSIMDRDEILEKINKIRTFVGDDGTLPNVYLLHGELEDTEVNELYNHPKVKAHVSFTKGEGYGRPLLEASISQKPVIAPNYSGHIDFLDAEMSVLLPGQITQIHPSAVVQNMLIPESGWFTVDYKKAAEILEDVYKNYKNYVDGAKKQSYRSRTEFSLDKMGEKLIELIDNKIPKPVQLKLPQLKKIELPKLKKVEDNDTK